MRLVAPKLRGGRSLLGLLRKEAQHIRRDPRTLAVILMLPVVQVVLFGFAIRTDVDHVRLAIVDPAPDETTLALRSRFTAAGVFDVRAILQRVEDIEPLLQSGAVQEAVVFERDFAKRLRDGDAHLLIVTDGTEPNTASLLQAYAQAVVVGYAADAAGPLRGTRPTDVAPTGDGVGAVDAADPLRGTRPAGNGVGRDPRLVRRSPGEGGSGPGIVRINAEIRTRFNPTRESSNLFVPGLMAFVLTIISSLMTAISLTREKETGTLEALLVSPLRPWSIIVGKVFPYLVIGFVSALAVIAEARLIFQVPVRGSLLLLLADALLFILASLALGILVSARTSSQRVAMMGAALATLLPNLLLSGFIFPVESMPWPLRWLSIIVPGRWFVEIARGIMLKGTGLEYLWPQTLVLVAMSAVLLMAAARSFNARLE
jgi:ABC-2 type transport system permease protein